MHRTLQRIATIAIAATVAGLGLGLGARTTAYAATYEELQARFEEASASYDEAIANLEQIQRDIDVNEARIADLEAQIPLQRARAAESLRTLYKMQQSSNGLIDLVLSADSFNEFITTVTYLDRIQSKNMTELQTLADLVGQFNEAQDTLHARQASASQEADSARQAQEEALRARDEARQQALAKAEAERAEAQAALARAAKEAEEGKTFKTASGQEVSVTVADTSASVVEEKVEQVEQAQAVQPTQETPKQENTTPVVIPASKRDEFVNTWTPRIDAYLSGSPLAGYGKTFAEAAWDYNVDPRWSPAIATIESSTGAICFLPHNAWGWGDSSWDNWDTAIRSHVAGLASGYGYTISTEAAQKYCPPSWGEWYSSVLAEMNSI